MTHPRTSIRKRVKEILLPIGEFDGRVFTSRAAAIGREEMPIAVIYTADEQSEQLYQNCTLDRELEVSVEIFLRDTDNPDEAADDLAELVEAAWNADPKLNGLAINSWLDRTETQFDASGEKINGGARLVYRVRYLTKP